MFHAIDVNNIQSQNSAAAAKDWETYQGYKSRPKKPSPAEVAQSVPESEATRQSDAALKQLQSFQFSNEKNLEKDRAMHEQVKAQIRKDGYMTKAAMIAQNYSTRSEKGHAMLGS